MRRILIDFTRSADDVKARVRKEIPDLTNAKLAKWDAAHPHDQPDMRTDKPRSQ